MEFHRKDMLPPCNVVIHYDPREAESFRPEKCPLCQSTLKLYQIHFDEKFLMCGNVNCAYPIGITDYHIYKIECTEEVVRHCSSRQSASESSVSYAEWLELEKSMQNDHLLSPASTPLPPLVEKPKEMEKLARIKEESKQAAEIRKNVKKIQQLNKELRNEINDSIGSEKWLRQIAKMEERSGVQLLKQDELQRLKKHSSQKELKIDLDTSGAMVSLKIDVLNSDKMV